jgi:hypothetical protein
MSPTPDIIAPKRSAIQFRNCIDLVRGDHAIQ